MTTRPPLKLATSGRGIALGVALIGALLGVMVLWFSLTVSVPADAIAVRQIYLGPNKGVQKDPLGPGLHMVIPGYDRLHLFPRDVQTLDFNDSENAYHGGRRPSVDYAVAPAIRIQTSEGYQVTVDVTVLYRVVDPYTVLTQVGAGRLFESQVVARRSDKILRQTLGQLNAEEFFDEKVRMTAAESARKLLQEDLQSWGIQIWAVLLREYTYDDRYQQAIEDRKIQDQTVFKNQAERLSAEREAEKKRVLAEGAATIEIERERGRAEIRKIEAEADLYARQRAAEGDLLVALAEAEGTQLENRALQQTGAANLVGLEMAETLDGVEVIIVSTTGNNALNPLDLDALMEGW